LFAGSAGRDYIIKADELKLVEDRQQGTPPKKAAKKGRKK
jgi:hypothetical protein